MDAHIGKTLKISSNSFYVDKFILLALLKIVETAKSI